MTANEEGGRPLTAAGPAVRRGRAVPRSAQRGASDTFRKPSMTATSMGARLCSFSRLTSVTTEPSSVETYRAGTRLRANTITSARHTSQPQKSG